jgi:PHD/YefM family antitoxin component YafN of YafNO toxin-antitoxin module
MVPEPTHVDEPQLAEGYADVLSDVASNHRPVIVRRQGEDLAAVIPLEYFELLRDSLARDEAQRLAGQLEWNALVKNSTPSQSWFDEDEPKPF